MIAKTNFITPRATALLNQRWTISFDDLANDLNVNGYKIFYQTSYSGDRGVARLVHVFWKRLDLAGRISEHDAVAWAFAKASGAYVYE